MLNPKSIYGIMQTHLFMWTIRIQMRMDFIQPIALRPTEKLAANLHKYDEQQPTERQNAAGAEMALAQLLHIKSYPGCTILYHIIY